MPLCLFQQSYRLCLLQVFSQNAFTQFICLLGFVAYSNPPVEVVGSATVLSKKIALLTKRKMATILNIARDNGTYTLCSLSITLTDPRT